MNKPSLIKHYTSVDGDSIRVFSNGVMSIKNSAGVEVSPANFAHNTFDIGVEKARRQVREAAKKGLSELKAATRPWYNWKEV